MSPKLLLFDIDGTILKVDEGLSKSVFLKVFSKLYDIDIRDSDIDFDFSGLTDLNIIYQISARVGLEFSKVQDKIETLWLLLLDEFKKCCRRNNIHIFQGVVPFIEQLSERKDVLLGLLTGNFRQCAFYKLNLIGLDEYFPIGAFGDESIERSDLHRLAIQRANEFAGKELFSSANTFVLGDSVQDIVSAKKNGIKVIAVATGRADKTKLLRFQPDLVVDSFFQNNEILKFIGI
jgi:phosphoglycolate phosphatase